MYEVFNPEAVYFLPSGRKVTGEELRNESSYAFLKVDSWLVDTDGVFARRFKNLSSVKEDYKIRSDDPQIVCDYLNELLDSSKKYKDEFESKTNSIMLLSSYYAKTVPDKIALEVPDLYPVWAPNTEYEQNERITYNGQLYKVAQKHTSQDTDGWRPGESGSAALYSAVTIGSSGHDQWKMPTGAHDAYNMDDIVEYNGKLYQSKMNGNTTIPGQSRFWVEYTE